jgi:hypothetical protein
MLFLDDFFGSVIIATDWYQTEIHILLLNLKNLALYNEGNLIFLQAICIYDDEVPIQETK